MRLIGMLDSPYVRRTAISLGAMNVSFVLEQISVFSTFDQFSKINPVVKAPTLITDDGIALVDSSLIIEYAAKRLCGRSEVEEAAADREEEYYRILGLSLVACEKALQVVYERALRPADKVHEPWLHRVLRQVKAAYSEVDREYTRFMPEDGGALRQPDIVAAVAWKFAQKNIPDVIVEGEYNTLASLSHQLEDSPQFRAYPYPED